MEKLPTRHDRPVDPVVIDLDLSPAEADAAVKALCIRVLVGWQDLKEGDMEVTPITGGITNKLVKVAPLARHGLQPVAVKVFGANTEVLLDRDAELESLLMLNDYGFGAQVLALFGNGRVEAFLHAQTLEPDEMADPAYVPGIAALLRRMHGAGAGAVAADTLWLRMWAWLAIARAVRFDDDAVKAERFAKVDFSVLEREMRELQAACDATRSPVVFTHNDLLCGNILIVRPPPPLDDPPPATPLAAGPSPPTPATAAAPASPQSATAAEPGPSSHHPEAEESQRRDSASHQLQHAGSGTFGGLSAAQGLPRVEPTRTRSSLSDRPSMGPGATGAMVAPHPLDSGTMQFIDFEYSDFTARGFDFGNHFNEYAGFDCDYSRYPNLEQQRLFFTHYLAAGPAAAAGDASAADAAARQLDQLLGETAVFSLASHMLWGVWALVQARHSLIDFDYLEYHNQRLKEYHSRKSERMKTASQLCGGVSGVLEVAP